MVLTEEDFVVSILDNKYFPQEPTFKQSLFLLKDEKEGLFGGQAGGGKSSTLLMAALQYVSEPKYSALILRRSYADLSLPGAIMDRANEWLRNTDAKWSEQTKTWKFPSGATLTFGYLEHENDKYRYQGAEFHFIAFDELTQFSETQYSYLFSRLRRLENSSVPLRIRAASNPGGVGHEWVKARFITPRPDDMKANNRFFIPASLDDNPFIDQAAYEESLEALDPITKAQLKDGNWDIVANGNMFKREWFKFVDTIPHEVFNWVRFWDMAATEPSPSYSDPDYTAGVLMGELNGLFYIADIVLIRLNPAQRDEVIKATIAMDGPNVLQRMEQEGGASGKDDVFNFAKTLFKGTGFQGIKSSGSKEIRARGFSGAVSNGLVFLKRAPWNSTFINFLCPFPQKGVHDDPVDASSGAYNELIKIPIGQAYETSYTGTSFSSGGMRI
ncbi:MAG: phage terminase large subunit [Bacteroidales bacterium]